MPDEAEMMTLNKYYFALTKLHTHSPMVILTVTHLLNAVGGGLCLMKPRWWALG